MLYALMLTMLLQGSHMESPSCIAGEGWTFAVHGRDLDKSPRWKESVDTPPLSPRAAIRSARALLRRMSCPAPDSWELDQISLRPVAGEPEAWIYVVRLLERAPLPKRSVGSVLGRVVEVPVLLDGAALVPSVGPWPPRQ